MKKITLLCLALLLLLLSTACASSESTEELWLPKNGKKVTVATLTVPKGLVPKTDVPFNGDGQYPELYYAPDGEESPINFFFYTTGTGDPKTLAETALKAYTSFYDEYVPGEVREETFGEKTCTFFDYTVGYPDESGTGMYYEHAGTAYISLTDGGFVAVIVSTGASDMEALPDTKTFMGLVDTAVAAVSVK